METSTFRDLRQKASRYRELARAIRDPRERATLNYYAERLTQQLEDQEAVTPPKRRS